MSDIAFGNWLTQRRKALDLTREELAQKANVSAAMLRKLEVGERRPSKALAEAIAEAVAIPIEQRSNFVQFARAEQASFAIEDAAVADAAIAPTVSTPPTFLLSPQHIQHPNNLRPALTKLIGREDELARLRERIVRDEARLVTLVGPPGIGKTSLAQEFARRALNDFPDGVFFVSLAPLNDAALVAPAILQALGITNSADQSPLQTLQFALRDKQLLLVLDNFEHVLEATTALSELLSACVYVRLLMTSREPLRLRGERQILVSVLRDDPAMTLFAERAREVDASFEINADNAADIGAICTALDGMPLALELAASWIGTLTCREITREIGINLDFLSSSMRDMPERQRSLRAAFNYSWELLTLDEQRVLSALSVFRGGFTREAAEQVANTSLPVLAALTSKSLLRRHVAPSTTSTGSGEARYDLHEFIRQYAHERLREGNQLVDAQRRHAAYYLKLAQAIEPELEGPHQQQRLAQLSSVQNNCRAALRWSLDSAEVGTDDGGNNNDADVAVYLCAALWRFWYWRNLFSEGRQWLSAAIHWIEHPRRVVPHQTVAFQAAVANVYRGAGALAWVQSDSVMAQTLLDRAFTLDEALLNKTGMSATLYYLGRLAIQRNDVAQGRLHLEDAVRLRREVGDAAGVAWVLNGLGWVYIEQDEFGLAQNCFEESLSIGHALNAPPLNIAPLLDSLGWALLLQTKYVEAERTLKACILLMQRAGEKRILIASLEGLGVIATVQDHLPYAVQLFAIADLMRHELGVPFVFGSTEKYMRTVAAARIKIGEMSLKAMILQLHDVGPDKAMAELFLSEPSRM